MKLPIELKDILINKELYIDKAANRLDKILINYQKELVNNILKKFVSQLELNEFGKIKNTLNNYKIVSIIDSVVKDVAKINSAKIKNSIITTAKRIGDFNLEHFTIIGLSAANITSRLNDVNKSVETVMFARLGIIKDRIVKGGFIDNFTNPNTITNSVSQTALKHIIAQKSQTELINTLLVEINGEEDKLGLMQRHLRNFAHDMFIQYDRAYSDGIAKEFEMNYFVYAGGLIETSRDFCIEMNDRVFNINEVEYWKTWTPEQRTRDFMPKQKCLSCVPSYIDFDDYDPLIDMGGYNCRHSKMYISDKMAKMIINDNK